MPNSPMNDTMLIPPLILGFVILLSTYYIYCSALTIYSQIINIFYVTTEFRFNFFQCKFAMHMEGLQQWHRKIVQFGYFYRCDNRMEITKPHISIRDHFLSIWFLAHIRLTLKKRLNTKPDNAFKMNNKYILFIGQKNSYTF